VYALNASTGRLLWRYPTGAAVFSSLAVANGVVYAASEDGSARAFGRSIGHRAKYSPGKQDAVSKRPDVKMLRPDFNLKVFKPNATRSGAEL
jgi:outer membrane protein assembly factor BamB